MNNVAFVDRGYSNLRAIEAYRTVALSQGPGNPSETNGTNGTNGTYGIQDTVELSNESLRMTKSGSNGTDETDETNARIHYNQKGTRLRKAASISDSESEENGRNGLPPRVSNASKGGPLADDLHTSRYGGVMRTGIPGSTQSNQTNSVDDVTNVNKERTTEDRLNLHGTTGNPSNSAVNRPITARSLAASQSSAGVPPTAPTSLESAEGADRKVSQLKTEDVNKTGNVNVVQRNEASGTEDLSKELKESEAVRTREFLRDRYREPGVAVYVEPNNLTGTQNYTDTTLLQNVGSQIAQASAPVNRISVYA